MYVPVLQKNTPEVRNETVSKYIKGTYLNSMYVCENTPSEVINIVNILKSSNSVGYYQISPNLMKMLYLKYTLH